MPAHQIIAALLAVAFVAPFAQASTPAFQQDTRLSVTLLNSNSQFRDVKISGHTYTVEPRQRLTVTAPTGTAIYSDCNLSPAHRGDLILQMSPANNHQSLELK